MTALKPDNVYRLEDGRLLGFAEYGDLDGKPSFFFHGFPGSRLEAQLADSAAKKLGIRVVAIDRPGYGLSDFKAGRTIIDWPSDVVEMADALKIDRFAVAGLSGGGPYAAVCALKIPERLTAVGIISGVGPFGAPNATEGMSRQNRVLFGTARRAPWLMSLPMWLMARAARSDRFISLIEGPMPGPDKAVLARPEIRAVLKKDAAEAFRSGSRGVAWEAALYSRPWGFRLKDIAMEVHLWQGEEDVNVPPSMGHYQARTIPNCRPTFYPNEGHLLIVDRMEEILHTLIS
jgi:pimeloyl-ACP methyl ester carboxylesterase